MSAENRQASGWTEQAVDAGEKPIARRATSPSIAHPTVVDTIGPMPYRPPHHVLLEFVRADQAGDAHLDFEMAGDEQVYLLRNPDGSGRYADGFFTWNSALTEALQRLSSIHHLEEVVAALAAAMNDLARRPHGPSMRPRSRAPWPMAAR